MASAATRSVARDVGYGRRKRTTTALRRWRSRSAMRGWQMAVIEIAIIVRSSASLERTRGAPERRHVKSKYYIPPYNSSDPFRYRILPAYN